MNHRVIVTCGPSFEPIDEVRRITNFSTGELGVRLANAFTVAGAEVRCFRGLMATCPEPLLGREAVSFSTNDDLLEKLKAVPEPQGIAAVFHAAALADFRVSTPARTRKIASREGPITLTLVPATKLIGQLRGLFGNALIVGWKFELDGTRPDALKRARSQMREHGTTACIVNGAAYGSGFGFLTPDGRDAALAGKTELCAFLVHWLSRIPAPS